VNVTPLAALVEMKLDFQTSRRQIARLSARQYGNVTRRQLLALRVPSTTIDAWIRDGRLVRVHQGVYTLAYRRVEPVARAMAAVLATGPGSVLSHDSALALWDLRRWPDEPEVITPRCTRRPGILAHRSSTLTARQTTTQLGVTTTRVARALIDIRIRLTERQRVRLTNQARLRRLISAEEAQRLLGHSRNPTRSGLEDDFQRWLEHHHLPSRRPMPSSTALRSTRSTVPSVSSSSSTPTALTATQ
jgi:hypothetical protein